MKIETYCIPFQDYIIEKFSKIDITQYTYKGLISNDSYYIYIKGELAKKLKNVINEKKKSYSGKELLIVMYAKYFNNYNPSIKYVLFANTTNIYRIES